MIRILLPVLLLLVGLGGGVGAGMMLSGSEEDGAGDHAGADPHGASEEDGHGSDEDEAEGGYGDDHGEASDSDSPYEYVRLNNQFIVPIIRHGSVRSLVVMSLTVEVLNGSTTLVYDREPRLRDAFLRAMFSHANVGGFDGSFTAVEAMAPLRTALRESARQILGEAVHDVLIVDIVRQDA